MRNLNRIHLNGLRAVEAVGRLGSLQAAAEELGVSVGAVSQQVIRTEQQLGRKLFDRQPKGLVPGDFGSAFLARLTGSFQSLSETVDSALRREDCVLTISVAPVLAARWLVSRIDSFATRYPEIRLRIDATTRLVDPGLSDVDLCIRVGDGSWPSVQSELLLPQEIFPVCPPALASRLARPEDLASVPAVIDAHAMFSWDVWLDAAGVSGLPINKHHIFNEASLCLDAVIAGQGVMLAWQTLACDAIAAGRLVVPFRLRARTGFGHYFVTARDRRESASVRAFKAWIREEMESSMQGLDSHFV